MIELQGLSEPIRGRRFLLTRLPATVGRAPTNDLILEGPGIWDSHLRFDWDHPPGVRVQVLGDGPRLWINGQPATEARLALGDCLTVGGLQLRFALAPTRQKRLMLGTVFTWFWIGSVLLAECAFLWGVLD